MSNEEVVLRKRFLLEDFSAAGLKLQASQAAALNEAQFLEEVVHFLKHRGERGQVVAMSALEEHLSGKLPELIKAMEDAANEKVMLQQMLSDIGISVTD